MGERESLDTEKRGNTYLICSRRSGKLGWGREDVRRVKKRRDSETGERKIGQDI